MTGRPVRPVRDAALDGLRGALRAGGGSANARWFDGDIAELVVYDRALSGLEIRFLRNPVIGEYATPLPIRSSLDSPSHAAIRGTPDTFDDANTVGAPR